jgi:hypothetical protein
MSRIVKAHYGVLLAWLVAYGAGAGSADADDEIKSVRLLPSAVNLSHIERLAILPFQGRQGDRVGNPIGVRLQETGQFQIVERAQLDHLLAEHNFTVSGLVDESSAADVGRIAGVEALVYGSVDVFRVYDESTQRQIRVKLSDEEYTDDKGRIRTRAVYGEIMAPAVIRRGELVVTVRVVDVASGHIMAQKDERQTFDQTQINHPQAAQTQLPSMGDIEQQLIDAAVLAFCRHVAPYSEEIELRWDGHCDMDECRQALRLLRLGMLDDADAALQQLLAKALASPKKRQERRGRDENLASIYYSLGVLEEHRGALDKAQEWYAQAIKARIKDPANKQTEAHARVEAARQAWAAYHAQAAGRSAP